MKTHQILAILLAASLILVGCSKKEPAEPATPSGSDTEESVGIMDSMKQAASEKMQEATDAVKQSFAMDIDLDKTVSDLKAQADKMSLEDLRAVVTKYKTAITEKQVEIDKITEQLKAIPITEKMGTEAQQLTADLKTLSEALKPLTDRFQVYLDAIKAKGGNIAELAL